MATRAGDGSERPRNLWSIAVWSAAAFLLLLPAVAMRFTGEVDWDETDFIVMGVLLTAACGTYELANRMSRNWAYRGGVGIAVVASFLLIWINLAVGIIGSEDNPLNLLYGGVILAAIAGAVGAGGNADGMVRAMLMPAVLQSLMAVLAISAGRADPPGAFGLVVLNGFFVVLWLLSACLFRKASRQELRLTPR